MASLKTNNKGQIVLPEQRCQAGRAKHLSCISSFNPHDRPKGQVLLAHSVNELAACSGHSANRWRNQDLGPGSLEIQGAK